MSIWDLPSGWEWKPVAEIAKDTERRNPASTPDEPFRYVDISSVDNEKGSIKIDEVRTIEGANAPSRARKVIQVNDVIFATTRPYLKNIALVPQELNNQICSTGFCVLRAKEGLAEPSYFYYACRSQFFINQLIPKQRGANYPAVSDGDVYDSLIPIPYPDDPKRSLDVQRRIVARIEALLAEVREMRKLHAEITADTTQFMNACIQEIFGQQNSLWKTENLSDVAFIQTGIAKGGRYGNSKQLELPYIRVANVQAGYLDLEEIKTISIPEERLERYRLETGDLLLTEGGDYDKLGRGAIWEGQIDPCIHQNHVFAVRFEQEKVLPKFAEYEMQSRYAKDYFLRVAKKTTNLASINKTQLSNFPIRYPIDLNEQEQIVRYLDTIQSEVVAMQETQNVDSKLIDQMEQSILAQAFRGEL